MLLGVGFSGGGGGGGYVGAAVGPVEALDADEEVGSVLVPVPNPVPEGKMPVPVPVPDKVVELKLGGGKTLTEGADDELEIVGIAVEATRGLVEVGPLPVRVALLGGKERVERVTKVDV